MTPSTAPGRPREPNEQYAATRKGNKVFIHVLKPAGNTLSLKAIPGRAIQQAGIIGGAAVKTETAGNELRIHLPASPAALPYVIELTLDGNTAQLPIL